MTEAEQVRAEAKSERRVCLYGYVRGNHMRAGVRVHVPGCGDLRVHAMSALPDPCPLPERPKHRSLNERERLLYAPMAGVGGMLYDRDAVYIELGGSHSHSSALQHRVRAHEEGEEEEEARVEGPAASALVTGLREAPEGHTIDAQLEHAPLRLFAHADPLAALPDELEAAVASSKKKLASKRTSHPMLKNVTVQRTLMQYCKKYSTVSWTYIQYSYFAVFNNKLIILFLFLLFIAFNFKLIFNFNSGCCIQQRLLQLKIKLNK